MDDELFEIKKKTINYELGSDLSSLSVDELKAIIDILKLEIEKLNQKVVEKSKSRSLADSFFKK